MSKFLKKIRLSWDMLIRSLSIVNNIILEVFVWAFLFFLYKITKIILFEFSFQALLLLCLFAMFTIIFLAALFYPKNKGSGWFPVTFFLNKIVILLYYFGINLFVILMYMIKFLLHGGVTSPRTEKNKKFFQHVVKEGGNKILIFPFAKKKLYYQTQFEGDSQKFIDNNPDVDIECAMASDDIEVLVEQIKEYKSLYFCGGLQSHHLEILEKIDGLRKLLEDKVISGNSAGTMIWTKHFFTGDYNRLEDGLGWLPIKVMVHWQSERYDNYSEVELEKLKKYGEDLPVYTIREQEYEVFEI